MKKDTVYEISNFSNDVRRSDLYVNTFSAHLKSHYFIEKPHRHNFYLLVLFTNGSGSHDIDFDRFDIAPGSLFLLQPGQIHNWRLSKDIEGYIVFFRPQAYNLHFRSKQLEEYPFYRSAKSNPELQLDQPELQRLLPYFELMAAEYQGLRREDKLLNLLDTIHIEIAQIYLLGNAHAAHRYNYKIQEFEALLAQFYKSQKSPAFYAAKMNMTLKHLNRICKSMRNETVSGIIAERLVLEAKRLLSNPKPTVSEVADELGFENYPYFGKLFKKHTGFTPGEFRKSLDATFLP